MNTISDYMSQKDEIARLNKQLDMIAGFYINQNKKEVKEMKRIITNERKSKSDYKVRLEKLRGKLLRKTRTEKALEMIAKVKIMTTIREASKEIAKKCFLSESYVYNLWTSHAK